jgi:hypothetical protein
VNNTFISITAGGFRNAYLKDASTIPRTQDHQLFHPHTQNFYVPLHKGEQLPSEYRHLQQLWFFFLSRTSVIVFPGPHKRGMFGASTPGYGPPPYDRQDGKKRAVGTTDSLALGLGGSSATSAEVVYVLAIALGLGVARGTYQGSTFLPIRECPKRNSS